MFGNKQRGTFSRASSSGEVSPPPKVGRKSSRLFGGARTWAKTVLRPRQASDADEAREIVLSLNTRGRAKANDGGDTATLAAAIEGLCIWHAWHAADASTLLLEAAETDKSNAMQQVGVLQRLLPNDLAAAIDAVSFHASWHAANLRRLVVWDACKQAWNMGEASVKLAALLPDDLELAQTITKLAQDAAWHAS